jgi:uncharacterized SAM-binding protein YcdF (DUF218 family)
MGSENVENSAPAVGVSVSHTPKAPHSHTFLKNAASGAVLGVLAWEAGVSAGVQALPFLRGPHGLPLAALVGALLGLTRARVVMWWFGGVVAATLLLVGYTPWIDGAFRSLLREDPLQPTEAVVVLSSDIFRDGGIPAAAQSRLLRGFEVIRQGYGRRLVVTHLPPPKPSYVPAIREQMQRLGLQFPIEETPEPVWDTHDEAVAVSRLARERGWSRVILVSDPSHLRRAAAAFEKAGVGVLCAPGAARNYNPRRLQGPQARVEAFRDWLYEVVGFQVYRMRGWI